MEYWHVLHVLGGSEIKIRDFLCKDFRNTAFIPKKKKVFRKQGVNNIEESVLFPNYVFVKTTMDYFEFMKYIQTNLIGIDGFIKLLKHDKVGTDSLMADEIDFLKRFLNDEFLVDESIGILEGDKVIVLNGPLVGYESMIRKIDRHKRLAWVLVNMFGEERTISIPLEIIRKSDYL